ncbi:hypothetical protein Tco_0240717 [Tanacetum coccineum]
MATENLSVNEFQEIKSKSNLLANLGSYVNDSSLVTYAINGLHNKFPEIESIIRYKEKLLTFDESVRARDTESDTAPRETHRALSKFKGAITLKEFHSVLEYVSEKSDEDQDHTKAMKKMMKPA